MFLRDEVKYCKYPLEQLDYLLKENAKMLTKKSYVLWFFEVSYYKLEEEYRRRIFCFKSVGSEIKEYDPRGIINLRVDQSEDFIDFVKNKAVLLINDEISSNHSPTKFSFSFESISHHSTFSSTSNSPMNILKKSFKNSINFNNSLSSVGIPRWTMSFRNFANPMTCLIYLCSIG